MNAFNKYFNFLSFFGKATYINVTLLFILFYFIKFSNI